MKKFKNRKRCRSSLSFKKKIENIHIPNLSIKVKVQNVFAIIFNFDCLVGTFFNVIVSYNMPHCFVLKTMELLWSVTWLFKQYWLIWINLYHFWEYCRRFYASVVNKKIFQRHKNYEGQWDFICRILLKFLCFCHNLSHGLNVFELNVNSRFFVEYTLESLINWKQHEFARLLFKQLRHSRQLKITIFSKSNSPEPPNRHQFGSELPFLTQF